MSENILTQEKLKQQLLYDAESGYFTWIMVSKNSPVKTGSIAGSYPKSGRYVHIQIDGKKYLAHRLAWLYIHGVFPEKEIDHINCIKQDNRLVNIRIATRSQNMANKKVRKDSKSGIKGIREFNNKWISIITIKNKRIYLGSFGSKEQASNAYMEHANQLYKEFAIQ